MSKIGVVGAGIGGTAVATMLARAGHAVTLFERAPRPGPVGAGLLLQPSGQRILQAMGLLEAIASKSERILELRAEQLSGRTLIRIPYAASDPQASGLGVSRGLLFGTLHEAAFAAGVRLVAGTEIERANELAEGVELVSGDGARSGPFDFALAADGGRSALRETGGFAFARTDTRVGALWATGPCTAVRGHLFQAVRGTSHLIGLLPMGQGRASFFWGCRRDELDALRTKPFADFRERVVRLVPRSREIFDELDTFERTTFATYSHVRCRNWVHGRVALLGDAAHAMSPHLGQGANLALADADAFVCALAAHGDFAAAALAYERERRPATAPYSALSRWLTPFFQSNSRLLGWGRDLALPALAAVPPIRRLMSRTLAGRLA